MARLLVRTDGLGERVLELKLGTNSVGRSPENDFQIDHPTISSHHCELRIEDGQLVVTDAGSTNGTFVDGEPIKEVRLNAGQLFSVGDVELYIETTDQVVNIPKIEVPVHKAPPVVLTDGSLICPRHSRAHVTHQCTKCHEVMCDACVRQLRRRGGKVLKLCPICSHKVELMGAQKKGKRSLLGFLQKTVKMPFLHSAKNGE